MDEFPHWIKAQMHGDSGQVSHGLNLALKLANPLMLPLLLLDIVLAKPKIERALDELSFLHFARFVPSWDGSALMVTTEFDGPIEPYVMDFVIALGDVFDTLLSYVDKHVHPTLKLPVSEHPDEFWNFVQEWNRVPFGPRPVSSDVTLLPPGFDYPVYSGYPDKTLIDIAGARTTLLPPAVDHPAAYVDLDDVQGNILSGYAAKSAVHMFFTVTDVAKARTWLSTVFPEKTHGVGQTWGGVMSAVRWKARHGTVDKPSVMANVGFTFAGLETLLPDRRRDGSLGLFPQEFRDGAHKRSGSNGDVDASDPSHWRFGRDEQRIHVVLSLYTPVPPNVRNKSEPHIDFVAVSVALRAAATGNGMDLVCQQGADALPDGTVFFGYQDGISKPRISGQPKPDDPDFQPAASPGEFLLGPDYKSIFGGSSLGNLPEDLATNGTFGALRLLEQDVDAFDRMVTAEAARLKLTVDELKGKLLGRRPDGWPLALDPAPPAATTPARNDFDYAPSWEHPDLPNDHAGRQCPVGAHVRRTNPRTARVIGQRHSRRLIRRGMPTTWTDDDGKKKVGLLGLFIGASLARQFEFIQQQWIQGDLATSGIRHDQDPIAGLRSKPTQLHLSNGDAVTVPPLVTTRGSLYLFFPGIKMLRGLGKLATPPALLALNEESVRDARRVSARRALSDLDEAEWKRLRGLLPHPISFLDDLVHMRLGSDSIKTLIAEFSPAAQDGCKPAHPDDQGDIKPLEPRFIADPFPAYAKLRAAGRTVVWVKEHQAYWVLVRDLAEKVICDHANFLQRPSGQKLRGIITMDEPRHIVVRAAVATAFKNVRASDAARIDQAIGAALDRIGRLKQFDAVTAYSHAVPRQAFWSVFGLPEDDIPACDALAKEMMLNFNQPEPKAGTDGLIFAYASVRLTARLALLFVKAVLGSMLGIGHPPCEGTLIGEIAKQTQLTLDASPHAAASRPLGFLESLMTLVQMVLASMSAQFLLSSALRNLLMPDPRPSRNATIPWRELSKILDANPTGFAKALEGALDEARRVDPPVTIVQRYAALDQDIGDAHVHKDCPVFAVVGSSNRDGVGGGNPEQYLWDRQPDPPNLSLGKGIHECVGRWLQQAVVTAAVTRLMTAMPDLQLCDTTSVPAWIDNIYFRDLQSLPVRRVP